MTQSTGPTRYFEVIRHKKRRADLGPYDKFRCYDRQFEALSIGTKLNITPSPVTAALAGVFSAVTWPLLWSRFGNVQSGGTIEVIVITLLVIALPAHAFVVGFRPVRIAGAASVDTALLKRIGAWLAGAGVTVLISAAMRS